MRLDIGYNMAEQEDPMEPGRVASKWTVSQKAVGLGYGQASRKWGEMLQPMQQLVTQMIQLRLEMTETQQRGTSCGKCCLNVLQKMERTGTVCYHMYISQSVYYCTTNDCSRQYQCMVMYYLYPLVMQPSLYKKRPKYTLNMVIHFLIQLVDSEPDWESLVL